MYKYGLDKTTYDDISEAAGINRALIPYYFKTKSDMGREIYHQIYKEFLDMLYELILNDVKSEIIQITAETLAYYRLFQHWQFVRLAQKVIFDGEYYDNVVKSERKFIQVYMKFREDSKYSEDELEIFSRFDYGIECEIAHMAADAGGRIDTDKLFAIELEMLLQHIGYQREEVIDMIEQAQRLLEPYETVIGSDFKIKLRLKEE